MKIKYLKIRNIASVERGDIDFEKGLCDPQSGAPASLFLITGDTGSGKTAILDCISMALYGTTPRVRGVNGPNRNVYKDDEGNEISIKDVAQYTRLGISHKDDCFAELSFEGNDGVSYVSRFTLGYTNRHTLRKPFRTLRIGDDELLEGKKKEIQERIMSAVGLSFEQFSRMAMLAQGQFATFLTGKKEEREEILEQLTATDRFSRYGEAITSIYRRKKDARKVAETNLSVYSNMILSDETRSDLTSELQNLSKEVSDIDALSKRLTDQKTAVENVLRFQTKLRAARSRFDLLSEDLRLRSINNKDGFDKLRKAQEWICAREPLKEIYLSAAVIAEKLKQVTSNITEREEKQAILESERAKTGPLAEALKSADENVKGFDTKLDHVHKTIERLTADLDQLNPGKLIKEQTEASERKKFLQDLIATINRASEEKRETAETVSEAEKLSICIRELQSEVEAKTIYLKKLEEEVSKAETRYTTMHLSVEKNFRELRRKLMAEHAERCPLCGQSIDEAALLHSESEMTHILSPLEEEKNRLKEELKSERERVTGMLEKLNLKQGRFKAKSETLGKLRDRDRMTRENISETLSALKLSGETDPIERLNGLIGRCDQLIASTAKLLSGTEEISRQMKSLMRTRKTIGMEKANADKERETISTKIANNNTAIATTETTLKDLDKRQKDLQAEIASSLAPHFENWEEDPLGVAERLMKEAEEYLDNVSATGKEETRLKNEEETIGTLKLTRTDILLKLAGFEGSGEPAVNDFSNASIDSVRDNWATLKADVSNIFTELTKNLEFLTNLSPEESRPDPECLDAEIVKVNSELRTLYQRKGEIESRLTTDRENRDKAETLRAEFTKADEIFREWERLNGYFGGTRFRTLVQSYILRPLLRNANIYLEQITDHYTLTCSDENEQLSILVLDRYNNNERRSVTVLSGGERFMISLALSLALSAMNRPDMNVDILFIDEGFGTLDSKSLEMVMRTLRRLPEIAGQNGRRVGVISHREELADQIGVQVRLRRYGEGRSRVELV